MNKIVLAQINTIAGNIENNAQKIIDCIKKAKDNDANIIIFPKFALTGFPFGDILKRHVSILKRQENALERIKEECENIVVIMNYADFDGENQIKIIRNKEILENDSFEINGETFGLGFSSTVDTLIKCTCDESRTGSEYRRNNLLSSLAKGSYSKVIYVNKVGYGNNRVFDGSSRIYDKFGNLIFRAKTFEEDFAIFDENINRIEPLPIGMEKEIDIENFNLDYSNDLDRTYKSIVFAIKEYFKQNGFKKAVLGLSGGLDSTISAVLLVDALGKENVYGISMPSKITSQGSKDDARILAENLGINFFEVPLAESIDATKNLLSFAFDNTNADKYEKSTTMENLQARTRATILWSVANEHKQMLTIATSDKSEAYIGYATVNGDMSGGFATIADVTKTKLFALGDFLNKNREQKNAIPQTILEKPPGAELKINPLTGKTVFAEEDNMPYPFLDEIIWFVENFSYGFDDLMNHEFYYEKNNNLSKEQKEEWIKKFFWKQHCAVFKWHILPPSVITDINTINSVEYHQPIISKVY